jgi:hypothetical protein
VRNLEGKLLVDRIGSDRRQSRLRLRSRQLVALLVDELRDPGADAPGPGAFLPRHVEERVEVVEAIGLPEHAV